MPSFFRLENNNTVFIPIVLLCLHISGKSALFDVWGTNYMDQNDTKEGKGTWMKAV